MQGSDSSKLRLGAALFGIVIVAGAAIYVAFGRGEPAKPRPPVTVEREDEPPPARPVPPAPLEVRPAPRPEPAPAPPPPVASAAATVPSPGAVSEMLVVSRRIETSDPKRSRELLSNVLAADPTNVTALERMSKKMISDEQLMQARELAERCLSVDHGNAECAALKAELPTEPPTQASLAEARACLNKNVAAVDCSYKFADNALYEGKKESAFMIAVAMNNVNPEAAATKLALGRVKAAYGAYKEALPYLQAACDGGDKEGCFRANLLRQEGF